MLVQWVRVIDNQPIEIVNATNKIFTIKATSFADAGTYRAVMVNYNGTVWTAPALLQVAPVPVSITSQPVTTSPQTDGTARFSVSATGSGPITYQWRFNGISIEDETSPTLVITDVEPADAGLYSVVVSNGAGSVSSIDAALWFATGPELYSGVTVNGPVGSVFTVEYTIDPTSESPVWQSLADGVLPFSPYLIIDPTPISSQTAERFYRVTLQP